MFKKGKINIIILILLLLILIIVEFNKPKEIDWNLSFSGFKKSPYGCYVLHSILPSIFNKNIINTESYYQFFNKKNSGNYSNIIIITDYFSPDLTDTEALLKFISNGKNVLISSSEFDKTFYTKYKIKTSYTILDTSIIKNKQCNVSFVNSIQKFVFNNMHYNSYFSEFDTAKSVVLGMDEYGNTNFIKLKVGEGFLYLHTQPLFFTNYHMLYNNYEYASIVLSYLPNTNTIFDEYYKPGRIINTSPVRYILSQISLRSAYYLLLISIFLYIFFYGKRKQRVIPVVVAPVNSSLEFIKTISRLHYNRHNYKDIARKKMIYLTEFIGTKYNMNIDETNIKTYNQIAEKSGCDFKIIEEIFFNWNYLKKKLTITDQELIVFNNKIEKFYRQIK